MDIRKNMPSLESIRNDGFEFRTPPQNTSQLYPIMYLGTLVTFRFPLLPFVPQSLLICPRWFQVSAIEKPIKSIRTITWELVVQTIRKASNLI